MLSENVLGTGFIAQQFSKTELNNITVYARGVSNTRPISKDDYQRDYRAVVDYLSTRDISSRLVYISSSDISTYQPYSKYLQHKYQIERLVLQQPNTCILRVPQVNNKKAPNSLLSTLQTKISNTEMIVVWSQIKRYPIKISDVSLCLDHLALLHTVSIIDARPKYGLTTDEIVKILDPNYKDIYIVEKKLSLYKGKDVYYLYDVEPTLKDPKYCTQAILEFMN